MIKPVRNSVRIAIAVILVVGAFAYSAAGDKGPAKSDASRIERGRYLVDLGGCNDCHSPKVMFSGRPIPHPEKLLSGHQESSKLPAIPGGVLAPDKWAAMTNSDLTAWVGPWGVSFAANLTPDPGTGLGAWTEEMFIKTLRTGKHLGTGRQILPPMPWQNLVKANDQDLKDIFAYLQSLKPVKNMVPQPIPPAGGNH